MDIKQLNTLKQIFIEEGLVEDAKDIEDIINETTSATGGSSGGSVHSGGTSLSNATTAGAGAIQSSQPSALPGAMNGADWMNGGGEEGSGDISVPYNPSGANRVFQKVPRMGKNHGSRTGKKSREPKLDIKQLKTMLQHSKDAREKGEGKGKVMSFDDFAKGHLKDVTKVKD